MELSKEIEKKVHIIAMDNFFTNVGLFKNLAEGRKCYIWHGNVEV
jgi:hypothetical protein